jgi:hypothetical protein
LPAATGISKKPACATDEYASSRLTLVWTMAARLPTTSDTHTMTARAIVQSSASSGNAVVRSRSVRTSAAAFVAAAMKAVTGVGAPS